MVGVSNDCSHLLPLHQQRLGQLAVDVVKHQPLSPQVVYVSAQIPVVRLGLVELMVHLLEPVLQNANLLLSLQHDSSHVSTQVPAMQLGKFAFGDTTSLACSTGYGSASESAT